MQGKKHHILGNIYTPAWFIKILIMLNVAGWEDKQKEAKEKYDDEYKEWLEGGGAEAIKKVNTITSGWRAVALKQSKR